MNDIIQVEALEKDYMKGGTKVRVLRGVNMTVHTGEMIAITGVSGVGKSTLLHLISTLDRPTGGSIRYGKTDPFALKPGELARFRNHTVGFVFQAHHLLPEFTALENVMIPLLISGQSKASAGARSQEILVEVGLENRMSHKPGELSGGEQQRVAVARALVNRPAVIIADEPTGNLDEDTGRSIQQLMRELNQKYEITFIIATHNHGLAAFTDRQYKLSEGVIGEQRITLGVSDV